VAAGIRRRLRRPSIDRGTIVAFALLVGAIAVRIAVIDRSLWLDETISVLQVNRPWLQVAEGQINNVHPPLFHLLLHGWVELFGTAAAAMRVLSILWSLLAVCAVWGWSREAFPAVSPVPAAALTAFSPFAVWYATEVRMYAQLLALVALGGWLAWRIFNRGATPWRITGLVAALTATAYTHYFAALFIASLGVVALSVGLRHRDLRRSALAVFGACVAAAVLLAPWVAYVLVNRSTVPVTPILQDPDIFTVFIAGLQMLAGFRPFAELGLVAAAWPLLCGLAVLLIPRYGAGSWRTIGVVAVLAMPPLTLAAASLLLGHSAFDSRYLTVCAAPLFLLGGWLFGVLVPSRARGPVGALVIATLVATTLWQNGDPSNPKLYDLKAAIATVNREARPGDAVLLVPQNNEASGREPILSYYHLAAGVQVVHTVPKAGVGTVSPSATWARVEALRSAHVFIVSPIYGTGSAGADAARTYDDYLSARAVMFTTAQFANVSVRGYAPVWGHR
jgi:hypothetical protein